MKTNRRIMLLILFIAGTGIFTLQAQNREERKELKEQTVKEKIESENYRIDINTAYPRRGPNRSIHHVHGKTRSSKNQLYRQKSRRSVQIQDNNLFQRFIQHRCRYAKP